MKETKSESYQKIIDEYLKYADGRSTMLKVMGVLNIEATKLLNGDIQ